MRKLSLCVLLLACTAVAQSPKAGTGPCALLTKAEIQEVSGLAVGDGAVNPSNKTVCDYTAGTTGSLIGIMLIDKAPGDSPEKVVALLNKRKAIAQVAPGIGDGAYAAAPGYGMRQIGAFKGSKHVIVTAMLPGAPEAKVKSVVDKVVRKAVGKL